MISKWTELSSSTHSNMQKMHPRNCVSCFLQAPSSLRRLTGSCIHEGAACPDKTGIRHFSLRGAQIGALIRIEPNVAGVGLITSVWWWWGTRWHFFTLFPTTPTSQVTLRVRVFKRAEQHGGPYWKCSLGPCHLPSSGWSLCFS